VVDFLHVTQAHLAKKGFENPRLETEYLLGHALGLDRVGLYLHHDRPLVPDEVARFRQLLRHRLNHEPLQWILGGTEFRGIQIGLKSGVFVPRPETEILVELTCERLTWLLEEVGTSGRRIRVLDIGTGSGAIALALAASIPELVVHGCDISPVALEQAQQNARDLGLEGRVVFDRWDVRDFKIPKLFDCRYDWVVMNPPYVPSEDWDGLPPEVQAEPKVALDGGPDGLTFYRRLVELLPDVLHPGRGISLEVGIGQAEAVLNMFRSVFEDSEKRVDYGGIERIVLCTGYEGGDDVDD
jgi:release factor glutamine methyltransferase